MSLPEVLYSRRKTRSVRVGSSDSSVTIGGNSPIVVQSMITEETHNVDAAVELLCSGFTSTKADINPLLP